MRYRLEKVIGEGGMGRVFLAIDLQFEQQFPDKAAVAIKILSETFKAHPSALIALKKEAKDGQERSHPNIVNVMHFDENDGVNPYVVMEYMTGLPLDRFIHERAPTGLSIEAALPIIEGIANGLNYLHEGDLIHSDFKPQNAFVTDDRGAKVLDLGIARAWGNEGLSTGATRFDARDLGAMTPEYASCEMFEGLPADPRDDVYALGCVTYELLTGHHPFNMAWAIHARGQKLKAQRIPGLSKRRWRVLQGALEFDRENRISSPKEFIELLVGEKVWRQRVILGLGALAVTGGIAAAVLGTIAVQPADPEETFLNKMTTTQPQSLTVRETEQVDRWLEQGDDYVEIANDMFENSGLSGIADGGHYLLSGGADNAFWAFKEVLGKVDNPRARQGIRQVLNSYANWSEALRAQSQLEDAMWTACQGLTIFAQHERLMKIADAINTDLADAGRSNLDCEQLNAMSNPPSFVKKNN